MGDTAVHDLPAFGRLEQGVPPEGLPRERVHVKTEPRACRHARVDRGTLCDFFAGRRRPTFGTLRAVCSAIGFALEDVISFPARA